MLVDFFSDYINIEKKLIEKLGKENGESVFKSFTNILLFKVRTKLIISELDLYKELYMDQIFPSTINFYKSKLNEDYSENEKKLIKKFKNPKHQLPDEITLLFYVGLYHKIENYETEILEHYNRINKTNIKELYKIGIDTKNKKKLFEDRDRLRLISNSIKHNRFFPKRELIKYYPNLNINEKISLDDLNPEEDVLLVKSFIRFFNLLIIMKSTISLNETLKENTVLEKYFIELTKDENPKDEKFRDSYLKK
ncbi:hypothetical protein HCG49_16705 [Arenibacter sp. 6A1]|uniref:hypothetical protein n=1 Tax=Arenibacter sp. 6A1 TaxID=2720391 RepID=UPI001445A0C3|nr:hypothetical protein [Arenibacter sp. 6A1]NKI28196.1 hypothetical protein [Arenibacter sp. 6A1]